jgi:hypothetical protein
MSAMRVGVRTRSEATSIPEADRVITGMRHARFVSLKSEFASFDTCFVLRCRGRKLELTVDVFDGSRIEC